MEKKDFIRENELPCITYMSKITGMYGVYEFMHNYLLTYRGMGFDDEEIRQRCTTKLNVQYALGNIKIEGESELQEFNHIITFNPTVPATEWVNSILSVNAAEYRGCRHFYSNYDDSHIICKICPYSNSFQNLMFEYECVTIQYALKSRDYTQKVKSQVDLNCFKGLYDLSARVQGKIKPVLFEITRSIMSFIFSSPLFNEENFNEEAISSNLLSSILKDMRELSEKTHSPALIRTLTGTSKQALQLILSYPSTCTLDEALEKLTHPDSVSLLTTDGIVYAAASNLGLQALENYYPAIEESLEQEEVSFIDTSYYKNQIFNGLALPCLQAKDVIEQVESKKSTTSLLSSSLSIHEDMTAREDMSATDELWKDNDTVIIESQVEQPGPVSIISEVDRNPLEDDICEPEQVCEVQEEADAFSDEPYEAIEKKNEDIAEENVEEDFSEEREPGVIIREIGETDNNLYPWENSMVVIPHVDINELRQFAISLDTGDARLHSIVANHLIPVNGKAKGGIVSIDFVSIGDGKFAYLLFIPKLNTYFYTSLQNGDALSIFSQVLSYASITKYCYQPYVLIAQLRKNGIVPKNIHSLFSISEILYPSHQMSIDILLEKLGAFPYSSAKGEPSSTVLKYMHCYHRIYSMRYQEILSSGTERAYTESSNFAEALSYSFLHSSKGGDSCLFRLSSAGNYHFLATADFRNDTERRVLCFSFEYSPVATSYIIRQLVIDLYKNNIFKSGDVRLLCIGTNFLTYSVPVNKDKWFDGKVHQMLLKLLQRESTRGLEYHKIAIKEGEPLAPLYSE